MKLRALFFLTLLSTPLFPDITVSLNLADTHRISDARGLVEHTVFLGDSFKLDVVISGAQNAPDEATIDGLDNFSVNSVGHHTNISIINSQVNAAKTTSHTLFPKQEGTFSLGPARVKHQGKTYESKPLTLRVLPHEEKTKHTAQITPSSTQQHNETDLFCRWELGKKQVVVGEAIPLILKIYIADNVQAIKQIALPEFQHCSVKKNNDDFLKTQQTINGTPYTVHEKTLILFPTKAGMLRIDPAQVAYLIQHKKQRSFGFFNDDFFSAFGGLGAKQKVVASNSLAINVLELPTANDNIDAVGTFQNFRATIDKNKVTVNEPIKLTLTLEGEGNFDLITAPNLSLTNDFKSYDSKTSHKQITLTGGTKSFEYILQAAQTGTHTIPSQTFAYLDVASKTIKTLQTDPLTLAVLMPTNAHTYATAQVLLPTEQETQPLAQDIHFIQEDTPATKTSSRAFSFWFFMLMVIFVPVFFFAKKLFCLLLPLLTRFMPKRKNLLPLYQKRLALLEKKHNVGQCYALFLDFLAVMSGQPKHLINHDFLTKYLEQYGMDTTTITQFLHHLNRCAQCSFTHEEMNQREQEMFYETSQRWLMVINRYGKKIK